ncbi:MAG: glutamate-cysteine ligase family protein [Candidatus Helarchaeota archaeon]
MKVGKCPVCFTVISEKVWKKFRSKVVDKKKFDCPTCGTELYVDPRLSLEEFYINRSSALIKYPSLTLGIEIESFSIDLQSLEFKSLAPIYVKKGVETGEYFVYDKTIGSEYNSPVFTSLNEAFFRIKTGLRKYFINLGEDEIKRIALIASYSNTSDTAGVHYHVGPEAGEELTDEIADHIAPYIHQQIPFLIAIMANSPIIDGKITNIASNRMIYNGESMCAALDRSTLEGLGGFSHFDEINLTSPRENKPPTLEVRVADSNIPEYVIAGLFIVYVAVNSAIKGKKLWNLKYYHQRDYERERMAAAEFGAKTSIKFNKAYLPMPKYIDAFFNFFRDEIEESNVSEDILTVFRLAKKGWVMADIVRESWNKIKQEDPNKSEEMVSKIFAAKYLQAQERNLNGENIKTFAKILGVQLPRLNDVKLGKYF